MSHYLDIHALHTLPPSNINRDDTNAPKTATFGGVTRQRVSSQAWKKAIRDHLKCHMDKYDFSVRTRRMIDEVVAEMTRIDSSWSLRKEDAEKLVQDTFDAVKIKLKDLDRDKEREERGRTTKDVSFILLLSPREIHRIAKSLVQSDGKKLSKRDFEKLADADNAIDISLFGRMVAKAEAYNVDAAVQVAHALGVGASEPEFDYFTAVDDVVARAEETGAGMIGTIQMMSSTLYRYATVDLDRLEENLGSRNATIEATGAFVNAFISSMPTGKQNTFANRTLPEAVVVSLRDDRPVSWVNAFEIPVPAETATGRREEAARKLAEEARNIDAMYDVQPAESWVMALPSLTQHLKGLGKNVNRTQLLEQLHSTLEKTLGKAPQA